MPKPFGACGAKVFANPIPGPKKKKQSVASTLRAKKWCNPERRQIAARVMPVGNSHPSSYSLAASDILVHS